MENKKRTFELTVTNMEEFNDLVKQLSELYSKVKNFEFKIDKIEPVEE